LLSPSDRLSRISRRNTTRARSNGGRSFRPVSPSARRKLPAHLSSSRRLQIAAGRISSTRGALYWTQSGDFVIMAVLGGMRSFWGPLIGAAIFVVLQDYLSSQTENWMSFVGLFFVLVVLFFPRGILGAIRRKVAS
jgi:hypothetical protein